MYRMYFKIQNNVTYFQIIFFQLIFCFHVGHAVCIDEIFHWAISLFSFCEIFSTIVTTTREMLSFPSKQTYKKGKQLMNNLHKHTMTLDCTGDSARCSGSQRYLLTKISIQIYSTTTAAIPTVNSQLPHGHPVCLSSLCCSVFISQCFTCSHLGFFLSCPQPHSLLISFAQIAIPK